jgi:O-succinylbenzoate synthase
MRVESIILRRLQMRLKAPFETSFGTTFNRPVLLVEMHCDGITGWSEVTATEGPFFNA